MSDDAGHRRPDADTTEDDQGLDADSIAEGIGDFLDPPADSPAADADAPPPG